MRKSSSPAAISSLISDVVEGLGLDNRLAAATVEEKWREVAGPQAARVTHRVRMKDGQLTVYLNDATWRHALHSDREAWRRRLNEALGRETVRTLIFR